MTMRILIVMTLLLSIGFGAPSQRIGQPLVLTDIYIPGGEAKPAPRRDRAPSLVVRLIEVKPAKDGFRYDFEIQGLDAGTHDLAKYLIPADPSTPPKFPEIPVEITGNLPAVKLPEVTPATDMPSIGGYRKMMITIGAVWIAGLIGLLLWRKKSKVTSAAEAHVPTLAERLRPLLDAASKGQLDASGRASLERLILGHWRARIPEIASLSSAETMIKLRTHPEASPLVLELERWLHSRSGHVSAAELDHLLAPYR